LTTDFRDIRTERRKTAISAPGPRRESPGILDFRDPFFSRNEKTRRLRADGQIRNLITA
jgi:hypothetical protein